jgi:hypothetical protein
LEVACPKNSCGASFNDKNAHSQKKKRLIEEIVAVPFSCFDAS